MPIASHHNTQILARNTQTVDAALATLAAITPIAQQQYDNALKINGIPTVVYTRLTSGVRCTCSDSHDASKSAPIFDEDGNATQDHIQSILTGTKVSIKRYGTRTSKDPAGSDTLIDGAHISFDKHVLTTRLDDPVGETVVGDDEFIDEVGLGAGFAGRCGVCFGTGWVGGFTPQHANRQVIDSTYPTTKYNATLNQDVYPHTMEIFEGGYLEFSLILIKGAHSVECIRLFDNDVEIPSTQWSLTVDGGSGWQPLTFDTLLNYCTGSPVKVRLTFVGTLTHLEIQLALSKLPNVEYPRLNATADRSVLEGIDPVSLNVGPTVPKVSADDVMVDTVYGKLWLVTASNWFNDARLNQHGYDVSARLIQTPEIFNLLYRPITDISKPPVIFNRKT